MAAERSVFIKVGAKVDGAVAGLRKVKAGVDDLTKADFKRPRKAFDDLSNKSALLGGAVLLGVGKAISSFADFDQAMSGVAANSGATGASLDALREKAIQLGSDTQFSATEAAQGINELAKAGINTQEILNGGLKGALDLAAAGQIGVGQAAETMASALNQFNQDGSQATHVADLLSNAASAAQGGVGDMGQALAQAGVAAHAAGLDIDETTTLLALFAKAGLVGSDAGTSLKTMMQRLSAPTEKAAETMKELGISAYDAQGQFVGAEELVRQLSESTKGLSTEAKMAAFNVIFGSDAIRAASIAAAAGADGYAKMGAEVTKVGGASDRAAAQTDNFKGDLERLGGSLETAFIQTGSSANDSLRTLTQGIGFAVDVIGGLPGPLILATTALGGLALTIPKGLSVYRQFIGDLDTMGLSLDKISAKAPRAGKALSLLKSAGIVASVAAVASEIQNVSAASEVAEVNVDKLAASIAGLSGKGQLQGGIADLFRDEGGLLKSREEFVSTTEAIERFNATAFDALSDGALAATVRMLQPGAEAKFDQYVSQIDAALAQMVSSGNADKAKASLDALINGIDDPQVREAARAAFTGYDEALKNVGTNADAAAGNINGLNDAASRTPGSASSADSSLQDMANNGLASVEDKAKDAKTELQDLLTLADSMAGNRRDIAEARAGLANAGDAAIEAAKAKGGADPDALEAARKANERLAEAKKSGTKGQIAAAQEAVIAANKRVTDSYVAPEKAQRDYEEAMRRVGQEGDDLIQTLIEQKRPISEINAAYDTQRQELIDAANARGIHGAAAEAEADKVSLTAEEMADLRWQYANTQAYVDTQVRTPGIDTAKEKLDGVWEVINGIPRFIPVTISVGANISSAASSIIGGIGGIAGTIFKRAQGGPINGVGSETSDSNIVLASRGEHMLTAAEVRAAGGHSAIFALRKALLSGGVEFRAQGGPIAAPLSAYRSAPPSNTVRVDLSHAPRGGDTFNMTAVGADADQAVQRGVRRLMFERSR